MQKRSDIEQAVDRMVYLLLSDEELSEMRREAIFRWLDVDDNWELWVDALDRYYKLHPRLEYFGTPDKALVAQGWREVAERLGLNIGEAAIKIALPHRPRRGMIWLRAAAVLLPAALIVGGWFAYERWGGAEEAEERDARLVAAAAFVPLQRVEPHADSVRHITLADGTQVTLNKNATFAYNDARECELKGEAWFKVAKDSARPFVIHSEHITAKVLGTEFHFSTHSNDGSSSIALYDGAVELVHAAGTHRLEAPGQEFTFHHDTRTHTIRDFDHTAKPDWLDAVEELSRFITSGEIFDLVEEATG